MNGINITGSSQIIHLSPIYFFVFIVLIGFIYHLIRNNEYKETLPASIIIGIIISSMSASTTSMLSGLRDTLILVVLVVVGGLLAVGLKRLYLKRTIQ